MAKKVSSKKVSGDLIVRRVKTIAKDSAKVFIGKRHHAHKRMKVREVTRQQVIRILNSNFKVFEQPYQNTSGEWQLTIDGRDLDEKDIGSNIRIGLLIRESNEGEFLVVVTVISVSQRRSNR